MAKSLFPESMMMKSELSLDIIASKLTYFQEQLHLLHWQTTGYAIHMALGNLYKFIQDFKDDIIEKIIGYVGQRPKAYSISLIEISPVSVINELLSFGQQLKDWGASNNYPDVENLADGLLGETSKTKYLLTLN